MEEYLATVLSKAVVAAKCRPRASNWLRGATTKSDYEDQWMSAINDPYVWMTLQFDKVHHVFQPYMNFASVGGAKTDKSDARIPIGPILPFLKNPKSDPANANADITKS